MRTLMAAAGLLLLAACDPTMEQYASTCQGYGFRPGTDAMANCVQQKEAEYRAGWAEAGRNIQENNRWMQQMQQQNADQLAQSAREQNEFYRQQQLQYQQRRPMYCQQQYGTGGFICQ